MLFLFICVCTIIDLIDFVWLTGLLSFVVMCLFWCLYL